MELDFSDLVLHKVREEIDQTSPISLFSCSAVFLHPPTITQSSTQYTAYSPAFRLDGGDSEDFDNECGDIHANDDSNYNTTTSSYVYDSSVFTNTVVTEWNLVKTVKNLNKTLY